MKVVIDTNILVSGLLSPFGASAEIVRMVVSGDLEICYDARIISEYEEVLKRDRFAINITSIENLLDYVKHFGYVVAAKPLSDHLPDETDEPFLEVAISAGAFCVITGNMKHYPITLRQGMKIFTPKQFLEQ